VARTLWLAGDAIGDPALKGIAAAAMEAVLRKPVAERRIDSPSFCHGVAGCCKSRSGSCRTPAGRRLMPPAT
jgi:hypothetical protein